MLDNVTTVLGLADVDEPWARTLSGTWHPRRLAAARETERCSRTQDQRERGRMIADARQFPAALAAALRVEFDYEGGEGVDFEPFTDFLSAEETTQWFQAWTGNPEVQGDGFRVFGQDSTGGYVAFWLVRPDAPLAQQPVVFLGSEGETGLLARNLGAFLWFLAAGLGPLDGATDYLQGRIPRPHEELTGIAEQYAPEQRQAGTVVHEQAAAEFPDFDDLIMQLCR